MKLIVFTLLPLALLASGQEPARESKKPAPKPAAKPASAAANTAIPADAKPIGESRWRYTDKAGKTWIYSQTPFGLSKAEETQIAPVAAPAPVPDVQVRDLGDTVKFERPMPFGSQVWERKKSELTAEEKGWLEKSRTSTADRKTTEK